MSSVFCTHCGAANPAGASFCQFCGSAITPSPAAPLPTAGAPAAPPAGWGGPAYGAPGSGAAGYPPPPRRSRARTIVIVLAVIVVVILVLGVVSYLLLPSATYAINVTGINIFSSDDTCGLNGETATGFSANTSQAYPITFQITGNNTTNGGTAACSISSVSTSTPGFSITGANVPLQVPVNASPLLSFTVNCPSSAYTGVLTLQIN